MTLASLYESVFRKVRGKGFGLGLFNFFHKKVYEGWLQPQYVEINGCRLFLPDRDVGVSEYLRLDGHWEPEMTEEFKRLVRPGMTVLDVGANIGYHAVLASRLVGPQGRVLAFEPEPGNLALLRKNLAANGCANVEVFPCAVGAAAGTIELHLSAANMGSHSTAYAPDAAGRTVTVPLVRLDDAVKPGLEPDVVKMDIEGGEAAALDGMPRLLANPKLKAVFLEINKDILAKLGSSAEEILSRVRRHGFSEHQLDSLNVVCRR
jgi:FkbM family methyltransferase